MAGITRESSSGWERFTFFFFFSYQHCAEGANSDKITFAWRQIEWRRAILERTYIFLDFLLWQTLPPFSSPSLPLLPRTRAIAVCVHQSGCVCGMDMGWRFMTINLFSVISISCWKMGQGKNSAGTLFDNYFLIKIQIFYDITFV